MDIVHRVTLGRTKVKKLPDFDTGDTVGVYVRVKEGEKERVQLYKGVVLKVQGSGLGKSFTVRKISSGIGVERTFPFASPAIDRVEVLSRGKVRRGRLHYLRGLKGRAARLDSELVVPEEGEAIDAAAVSAVSDEAAEATQAAPKKEKKAKAEKPGKKA